MNKLLAQVLESILERCISKAMFRIGAGSDDSPSEYWMASLREIFHYELTGDNEPAWHREIYGPRDGAATHEGNAL